MPKKLTHEEFLQKLEEKNEHYRNGKFEIIGEYKCSHCKLRVRNKYGECLITPANMLRKYSPSIASTVNKTQYFINQAREVHGERYDYSKVEYIRLDLKTTITCPIHGDFEQRPHNHLKGNVCPKCSKRGGYSFDAWKEMCPGNPGIFYILRCWNEDEEFYKVGITCNSVKQRYMKTMPYNYEIIKQIVDQNRERIWNLEKTYLSLLKDYHYEPKIDFNGSSKECFKI